MFFNNPDDLVVLSSAFFSGIGTLVFGAAGYYGIKAGLKMMFSAPKGVQAVRNK